MLAILRPELRLPIEVSHLRGNFHRRLGNVERFNPPHAALAVLEAIPKCFAADANGRYTAHSGDHNASRRFEAAQHFGCSVGACWGRKHTTVSCATVNRSGFR